MAFHYCLAKLIGGFIPNSVHNVFRIGRISVSDCPQSVSDNVSKIYNKKKNYYKMYYISKKSIFTSSIFSSGIPHESPCITIASYNLLAVDFLT